MLGTLLESSRASLWHVIASCVAYAGRFIRLLLLGLGVLILPAAVLVLLVWANASSAATEKDLAELVGGALAIQLFIGGLVWTALDYARVWIVRDRMASARRAFRQGARMLLQHPLATVTIQLTAAMVAALTVMLQVLVGTPLGMGNLEGIVAVVLLHQALVLGRSYLRLVLLSSQIHLTVLLFPVGNGQE